MNKQQTTCIITVNYCTADLVIKSIHAIASQKEALGGGQVIIVDNASPDNSADKISAAISSQGWNSWVNLIPMSRNGGFAFGNNIGLSRELSSAQHVDYFLLLNPDSLVRKDAIKALVTFMDEHTYVGIAGPRLENENGGIESSAHKFHTPIGELFNSARLGILEKIFKSFKVELPKDEAHQCDWVSGSCMIIRRKVIEDVGMMDEEFFLYFEEVDYFQRAAKAGWQTWHVPNSTVMHIEGASTGIKSIKRRPAYWYNSRRRYFVKHYGILGLLLGDMLFAIGRLSYIIRRSLRLGAQDKQQDPKWFMFDLLWGDFRALITGKIWRIK